MRHCGGFGLVLFSAAGLFGQAGVARSPVVSSGFGHVLSPARTSIPGLPGGGHARPARGPVYAYPVYVGGYGYAGSGYAPGSDTYGQAYGQGYGQDAYGQDVPPQAPQQQPANVTVVIPPQQTTVIINQYPADGGPPNVVVQQGPPPYGPPPPLMRRPLAVDDSSTAEDSPHYLLAFKDRSIYTAVAYWVDGDTLHYFTSGSTHNQVSLALVDRELTERLNREAGVDLKLPPVAAK